LEGLAVSPILGFVLAGALSQLPRVMEQAQPLIEQYGDDQKSSALQAMSFVQRQGNGIVRLASLETGVEGHYTGIEHGSQSDLAGRRAHLRDAIYRVISQLEHVQDAEGAHQGAKKDAKELIKKLGASVEYAPWWVRILSAICLGLGTMIGYKRIVTTLGERLGSIHLTPAQGAAAEVVAASIIGVSGFTGLPVSTTHIVTSGIGGTMVGAGAKLRYGMISRILMAWLLTLPVTTLISAGIYYFLADPRF
jgi:PiT family inorganic phosphate transporter